MSRNALESRPDTIRPSGIPGVNSHSYKICLTGFDKNLQLGIMVFIVVIIPVNIIHGGVIDFQIWKGIAGGFHYHYAGF
jgi:hypothetical protein